MDSDAEVSFTGTVPEHKQAKKKVFKLHFYRFSKFSSSDNSRFINNHSKMFIFITFLLHQMGNVVFDLIVKVVLKSKAGDSTSL